MGLRMTQNPNPGFTPGMGPDAPGVGNDFMKRASTMMQLDDGSRSDVASFFGDPQSRQFVQDSGNVVNAVNRPDNPWGGAMNYVFPQDASQQSTNPPSNPTQVNPTQNPNQNQATQHRVPMSFEEFLGSNPNVPMPQRPVADWDKLSGKQKIFSGLFLGMNKFGAALNHESDSYADQFFGNNLRQRMAQNAYDQNLPTMKMQANQSAYNNYLGQQKESADIRNVQSETDLRNRGMNPQVMQLNEQTRSLLNKAVETWTKDPRFLSNPDSFRRAMQLESQGLPIDPQAIEDVIKMPQVGTKWSVDYSKEGGVPLGLRNNLGSPFSPDQIQGLEPAAQRAWTDAVSGYARSVSDKDRQAKLGAQYRGDAYLMRPVQVKNTKTGMSKWVTGMEAIALTANPQGGWVGQSDDVNSARQKWSLFGDITDAANGLNTSLPTRGLSTTEVAQIATAVKEYHGPLEEAIKSKFLAGMKPDAAKLASAMLQMRDQIILLPTTMGMPPSDPRIQSLWNAMPSPGDLQNPTLAGAKMNGIYRMIHNLQQGLPGGSSDVYGIPSRTTGSNPGGNTGNTGNVPTRMNQKTGEVQQQINGQWVTVKQGSSDTQTANQPVTVDTGRVNPDGSTVYTQPKFRRKK